MFAQRYSAGASCGLPEARQCVDLRRFFPCEAQGVLTDGGSASGYAAVPRIDAQLEPVVEVELLVDVVEMRLDRALRDEKPPCDFPVTKSGRDHANDLDLSPCQRRGGLQAGWLMSHEMFERRSRRGLLQALAAHLHFANALDQKPGRHLFQNDAADVQTDRLQQLLFRERRDEKNDAGRDRPGLHFAEHGETVVFRHPDGEHENVRFPLQERRQHILATGAMAHNLEIAFQLKQLLDTIQNDRVVVGQQETYRHVSSRRARAAG